VRELVRTIVRVDLVAYDFKGVECNRKHYKAGPGDTIKWRRMVHRMVRLDAVAYDAEGHEIYRNEYRVLPGQDFTYIVAMPEDVHFELT
jgi:hypothetical protein